jgi:chemotaxis protein methyltransferase CheR
MTLGGESVRPPDAAPSANREYPFTRRDFRQIAAMLYDDCGIQLSDMKAPLVYGRLVKRLRALGIENFRRYCALVDGAEGAEERQRMTAELTTNVTAFFREPHHFEHLKTEVLSKLVEGVRRGGRLRIWSAGCSSGEEAYSIALSILEVMPDAPRLDVRVLATDINQPVLAQGQRGEYDETDLRPVSRRMLADWFVPERDATGIKTWTVGEELKTLVAFRKLNLLSSWPMKMTYQAIFCRNVLIYFDEERRLATWRRMTPLLAQDGRLYIGASERIRDPESPLRPDGVTTYRLGRAGDA